MSKITHCTFNSDFISHSILPHWEMTSNFVIRLLVRPTRAFVITIRIELSLSRRSPMWKREAECDGRYIKASATRGKIRKVNWSSDSPQSRNNAFLPWPQTARQALDFLCIRWPTIRRVNFPRHASVSAVTRELRAK